MQAVLHFPVLLMHPVNCFSRTVACSTLFESSLTKSLHALRLCVPCCSMITASELVDKGDIPEERKKHVKNLLHGLGYAAGSAVGKAFLKITKKDMTDAGMSIADANAILAEVESLQGSLLLLNH